MGLTVRFFIFIPIVIIFLFNFKHISSSPQQYGIEDILCDGPILHAVQMARLYNDSKTFVDMHLKATPSEIVKDFRIMLDITDKKPSKQEIRNFVDKFFEPENQELDTWIPTDWDSNPEFVQKIKDDGLRTFALEMNTIWTKLGRHIKNAVRETPDRYSLIWVPKPFVVPGGRFREFYYWDSFWIIEGLLISGMTETAKGMLENFVYLVDKFGHIPNGGRVYYLERSQPPLFVPMVKKYFDKTFDTDFIRDNIHALDKEFEYWMTNHMRNFTYNNVDYTMAAYGDKSRGPRPESYYEDVKAAGIFQSSAGKEAFYTEIKAAAESGWDFSSRWFYSPVGGPTNLSYTSTTSVIPVDLNAFLHWNAIILRDLHVMLESDKSIYYNKIAENLLEAIDDVLWDDMAGIWYDFDARTSFRRNVYFASNLVPLYTMSYPQSNQGYYVRKVLTYLKTLRLFKYPGGLPTSLEESGEQWDFPNAWPPLQHMIIFGLRQTNDPIAQEVAFNITHKWILTTYKNFNETKDMYEKYDAVYGTHGGGGEYNVQTGFGWTNGVVLSLLDAYGPVLKRDFVDQQLYDEPVHKERYIREEGGAPPPNNNNDSSSSNDSIFIQSITAGLCLIVSLLIGFSG